MFPLEAEVPDSTPITCVLFGDIVDPELRAAITSHVANSLAVIYSARLCISSSRHASPVTLLATSYMKEMLLFQDNVHAVARGNATSWEGPESKFIAKAYWRDFSTQLGGEL